VGRDHFRLRGTSVGIVPPDRTGHQELTTHSLWSLLSIAPRPPVWRPALRERSRHLDRPVQSSICAATCPESCPDAEHGALSAWGRHEATDDRGGGVGGALVAARLVKQRMRQRLFKRWGEMFEQMPDDLPPKRIIRQLEEIREQNARILQLVEDARATKNSGGGSASAHGRALDR
jgi:hypothetical protein